MSYKAAINELENALEIVITNEPINEERGDIEQARLERENAVSFRAAIELLKRHDDPAYFLKLQLEDDSVPA